MDSPRVQKLIKTALPDINIHLNHPLAPYTTINIGGPAQIFVHTTSPHQFISIIKLVHTNNLNPITILGQGSNTLISDHGLPGLVIKNSGNHIDIKHQLATISSGTSLGWAINHLLDHNLTGLETFGYIPASIGGAIFSNIHGFDKSNFSQFIDTIDVFDLKSGQQKTLKVTDLKWGYDYSPFQSLPHLIITAATFKLQKGDADLARQTLANIIKTKSATQPANSLGCVFKNPDHDSAGHIIDSLGLKGKTTGGAQISPLHANFIINTGAATATDYYQLARQIQQTVKTKTGIMLEFEIKLLGQFN